MDRRIKIRIHTKISWIRNTALKKAKCGPKVLQAGKITARKQKTKRDNL
jgi:hypothetical protein